MDFTAIDFSFDGRILERGFWLYVVEIASPRGPYAYVGRTGDTSSANAASLFSRVTSHLNPRSKGNALLHQLEHASVVCSECQFRFVGIGPLFEQQATMELHVPLRDRMARLERAVADHLRERGYNVLGRHPKKAAVPDEMVAPVLTELNRHLGSKLPAFK